MKVSFSSTMLWYFVTAPNICKQHFNNNPLIGNDVKLTRVVKLIGRFVADSFFKYVYCTSLPCKWLIL